MRDDVMKGKNFIGNFANDVEAHINGETTTIVFGETWPTGECMAFTKIVIPTKVFAKLGLQAFQLMDVYDVRTPVITKVRRGKK